MLKIFITNKSQWFILLFLLTSSLLINSNKPPDHDTGGHGSGNQGNGSHGDGGHGNGAAPGGHGQGHGEEEEEEEHEEERFKVAKFDFEYVKVPFIVGIWILYAICAKLFFHWEKYLSKIFPESCLLIIIGVIFGVFLFLAGERMYEVNTTIFFLVLLPPIILDAGYYMPARAFFDQLGTILLYAILGTLLNNLLLGFALYGVYEGGGFQNLETPLLLLHALVLGSLLAAVDPVAVLAVFESVQVNEMLYIIVFGESLLNDGISVVLYHLFEGYSEIGIDNIQGIDIIAGIASFFVIVFGATGIGMLLGLLAGFMSRFTKHQRKMEPLLVLVIGYLSFIIAEMFHLSGIISCTFCGITMRKYVEANYSEKSNKAIHVVLKMFAQASETIVFMYIGMSAVSDVHHWDTAFCILTLIFCLIFRTICVIIQTYFANMIRVVKLTKIDQFVMAYGGLRGAIAFALVLLLDPHGFPHRKMFITTTVLVIYFTNLAMGSTIEPLVKFLKVKRQQHRKPMMGEKIMNRFTDHVMGGLEDIAGQSGHHQLRERFSAWNNRFLKPLIVGKTNPKKRGWQILSVYNQINQKAAKHHLQRNETGNSLLFRDMSCLDLNRAPSSFNIDSSSSMANIPKGVIMQRGNWWESNVSISRTLQHDMLIRDRREDTDNIHHISEDIAGPILRVKPVNKDRQSVDSDNADTSSITEMPDDSHEGSQVPISFTKQSQNVYDNVTQSPKSGLSKTKKSVSFLDLGIIEPSKRAALANKIKQEKRQEELKNTRKDITGDGANDDHDLPIPWKSLDYESGDYDPVVSQSAGIIPPNLREFLENDGNRSSFDPPPAYGQKNYGYLDNDDDQSEPSSKEDEDDDDDANNRDPKLESVVVHSLENANVQTDEQTIDNTKRTKVQKSEKDSDKEIILDASKMASRYKKY